MILPIGLLLLPKLLIVLAVFLVLAILLRGQNIYEKLVIYLLIMLVVIFALSRL
ncbi:MAG: hypothetical protein KBD07_00190 [Candidatus Omnitrophica bacterium]|nr:hypothetical protein [Candidatus Omnitrophota bacterium]